MTSRRFGSPCQYQCNEDRRRTDPQEPATGICNPAASRPKHDVHDLKNKCYLWGKIDYIS
jgi:hypothetical protein